MNETASVAEFMQEVEELYFEFHFNQTSFNASFINEEA